MTDLVSGRYGAYDPMWLIFGKPNNAKQSNIPARSNIWEQKLTGVSDGALAGTEEGTLVAVPVQEGDIYTKVTYLVGGTGGTECEAGFVALYAGKKTGKLLAQSKSKKYTTQVEAGKPCVLELEKEVQISSENAPNGFIYVVLVIEAPTGGSGVIPTVVSSSVPKACQYSWFTNTPEVLTGTVGTGLKTTAEATLGSVTSKAVAPIVFLQ